MPQVLCSTLGPSFVSMSFETLVPLVTAPSGIRFDCRFERNFLLSMDRSFTHNLLLELINFDVGIVVLHVQHLIPLSVVNT
jgi:hypothetical protein